MTTLSSSVQQLKQNETEIAVLQVQYKTLDDKVGDLKTDLKDFRTHIDTHIKDTQDMIKGFQEENVKSHKEMATKISALEKWKWMLMGAGVLAGGMGFPMISKLLGMH
jgi:hypothetical protein